MTDSKRISLIRSRRVKTEYDPLKLQVEIFKGFTKYFKSKNKIINDNMILQNKLQRKSLSSDKFYDSKFESSHEDFRRGRCLIRI